MKSLKQPDYLEILESMQDAFVIVDKRVRFLYVNKKAEELIGFPKEELIGHTFRKAFPKHNLNLSSLLKLVKKAWLEKKAATLELYFKPQHRWYLLFVYPFKDKFSVIFRDITQRKNMQEALHNSQEQLDLIFKNVSDGIIIQDTSGKLVYANNAAALMGGFASPDEFLSSVGSGLPAHYDIYDEQRKPIQWRDSPGRQVLFGGKIAAESILCVVDKQKKREIWIQLKSARISSPKENNVRAISIFHNITSLKQLEAQKDNFLSLVSHELKTPLTSLKVYLQLLEKYCKKINEAHARKLVTKISSNTEQLVELIHSLLDVSRIQEGKLQLHKHRFSLTALTQSVIEDIQATTEHNIVLKGKEHLYIYADRERIAQVFINLITNAVKYSDNTKQIIVKIVQNDHEICTSVQDFGIGISLKDRKEIFDRFYQSEANSTFPGLGLGLYISSEIIKAHGGKIWVKSKEGKGSTFFFTMPLHNSKSTSSKYSL